MPQFAGGPPSLEPDSSPVPLSGSTLLVVTIVPEVTVPSASLVPVSRLGPLVAETSPAVEVGPDVPSCGTTHSPARPAPARSE